MIETCCHCGMPRIRNVSCHYCNLFSNRFDLRHTN